MKSGKQTRRSLTIVSIAMMLVPMILTDAFGQLQLYPIQRVAPVSQNTNPNARTKAENLNLPFWDDFSFTPVDDPGNPNSNYPLESLWEFSNSTWISSSIGIKPPSSNVATFDGVDSVGRPYSDQILNNGYRDKLVSRPINLGGPVSNVFLSFYYQWQGNGEAPDSDDFLTLEFLSKGTIDTAWVPVITLYPTASMQRDVFYDTIIQVANSDDLRYLYNGFQFRFRTYGRASGPFDTWNIDYVYLNAGRTALDRTPDEVALASTISPLFAPYYAIPVDLYFKKKTISKVEFDARSLMSNSISRDYTLKATFKNHKGGTTTTNTVVLEADKGIDSGEGGGGGGNIDAGETLRVRTVNVPDTTSTVLFDPLADSIDIVYEANLEEGDPSTPINKMMNDTIRQTYRLHNYYAYDDGSAEYSAVLAVPGNKIAIAFDIATVESAQLAGIDIYCPPFGLGLPQSAVVQFEVYQDDNGKPASDPYVMPARSIVAKGLNKFQRLVIASSENVFVNRRFYIGWTAPAGPQFHVGIDYSNDTSDKVFVKNNSQSDWEVADHIKGSFMIRPIFGENNGTPTGIEDDLAGVSIYPNPSHGDFFLEGRADVISIVDMKGQIVPFDLTQDQDKKRITLQKPVPGVYLVRLRQGRASGVQKIMVR